MSKKIIEVKKTKSSVKLTEDTLTISTEEEKIIESSLFLEEEILKDEDLFKLIEEVEDFEDLSLLEDDEEEDEDEEVASKKKKKKKSSEEDEEDEDEEEDDLFSKDSEEEMEDNSSSFNLASILDGNVKAFMKLADLHPPLNAEQERYHLEQIVLHKNEKSKEIMVLHNLRLVVSQAKKFIGKSTLSYAELLQEAVIGLLEGIKRFDLKYSNKFSTFAIRKILNALYKTTWFYQPVKISEGAFYLKNNIMYFEKVFIEKEKRNPTKEEICKQFGITPKRFEYIKGYSYNMASLDDPIGNDSASSSDGTGAKTLYDVYVDPDQISLEDSTNDSLERDLFDNIKEKVLTPKERKIYELVYTHEHTIDEVANIFGMSGTRIKQVLTDAIKKIKLQVTKTYAEYEERVDRSRTKSLNSYGTSSSYRQY